MDCATTKLYESLEHCKGQTIVPGMYDEVLYCPASQIVTYPVLPDLTAKNLDMASAGTLTGSFVLEADAKFLKIDINDTASNLTSTSQGEWPSKTFLNSSTIKYPGNNAAAVGFCRMANADNIVFLFHMRSGEYRVLGNKMFRTDVKPSQDSGMQVTDASGTTLEVSCTDLAPCPIYAGTVKVEGGTLDCSTGEVTADEATT